MSRFTNTCTLFFLSAVFLSLTFSVVNAQVKKKPADKKTTSTTPPKTPSIRVIKQTQPIIGGVVNGKAINLPMPVYPEDAQKLQIGGTVGVRVLIDETGNVFSAKAETGVDNLSLRTAAENAAMQAKFSPTLSDGKPVKVSGIITFNFVLKEDPKKRKDAMKFVGLGFFLNTIYQAAPNPAAFNELFDFKDFKAEFAGEFGNFSEDIVKEVLTLSNARELDEKKKQEAIDKVINSIFDKASEPELWQFKLGKDFSDLIGIFSNAVENNVFNPEKLDVASVKMTVANIKELLKNAPPEFPAKTLQKFNEFTTNADKLDAEDTERLNKFLEKLTDLINTISPE
jgi:TonB family protein